MALTDWNAPSTVFDPVARDTARDDALARLPGLARELSRDHAQHRLLDRSPLACVTLMILGMAALLLTAPALKPGFGWAALMLIGIIAMVRNFIRGAARSLRRVPLSEAVHDLQTLLLYGGAAWASGAWLLMPDLPSPALVVSFAVTPCLALALIFKDARAAATFTAPVMLGVAAAAILSAWPLSLWVASAIIAAGFGIILLPALQHGEERTPAGLTLR